VGYCVTVYATDLDSVRKAIGGSEKSYAKLHGDKFNADNAWELNEMIEDVVGGQKDAPKARDIARQMMLGEPRDERLGFAYGYFLEYLCEVYGTMLPNDAWCPVPVSFPGQVDKRTSCGPRTGASAVRRSSRLGWFASPAPGDRGLPGDRVAGPGDHR
jgi:hypothetical protein